MKPFIRTISLSIPFAFVLAGPARTQVTSSLRTITLTADKPEQVTLSAPSPSSQSVTLADGTAAMFANPFTTTVGWDVSPSTATTVKLVAYFTTPSQALVNGSSMLPAELIEISLDNGSTWHPITSNAVAGVGSAGGSYVLYTSPVTQGANRRASATVTFHVRINLTGNPSTAAGTYSGALNLIAICN
jgi:hypothetical protein